MCGKTTLARLLSQEMGFPWIDTDRLLEEKYFPLSCREIHQKYGDAHFRQAEFEVIHSLDYQALCVLATGGGAILFEKSASLLAEKTTMIYLNVSLEILKQRIWSLPLLPSFLLSKDPCQEFERLYYERTPVYQRWADHTLEMEGMTIEQSLESCMEILRSNLKRKQNGI